MPVLVPEEQFSWYSDRVQSSRSVLSLQMHSRECISFWIAQILKDLFIFITVYCVPFCLPSLGLEEFYRRSLEPPLLWASSPRLGQQSALSCPHQDIFQHCVCILYSCTQQTAAYHSILWIYFGWQACQFFRMNLSHLDLLPPDTGVNSPSHYFYSAFCLQMSLSPVLSLRSPDRHYT